MHIIGTHHCGKEIREEFKHRSKQHGVLCRHDYADRIVSSFSNKIQPGYYDGNWYIPIEGIALEHFRASNKSSLSLKSDSVSRQAVFSSFLLDDNKQDAATEDSHSKHIIRLLQNRKVLMANKSTTW